MDNVAYQKEPIASNNLSPESKRGLILDLVESLKSNELVEVSKDITGKPFEIRPGIEYRKTYQVTEYNLVFKNIHEFERVYRKVTSVMRPEGFDYFQYAVDEIKKGNDQNISYSFDFIAGPYKEIFEFKYEKKVIPEFDITINVSEEYKMQESLINQIEELIVNLHRNKNDNMEFRMVFGHDFKSRLTVLFGEEIDKISNQLEEFAKQMDICKLPGSSYAICQHPEDKDCKLYVYSFQTSSAFTEARYSKFVFLKGIRNNPVDLDDYPLVKQVKF